MPKENKKSAVKRKVGRPRFIIDYALVEELSKIHCTQEEIASILGCSVDTLQRDEEFCGIYKREFAKGKASLRRLQWESADDGQVAMQIWLGKVILSQKEGRDDTEKDAKPIQPTFNITDAKGDVKVTNGAK